MDAYPMFARCIEHQQGDEYSYNDKLAAGLIGIEENISWRPFEHLARSQDEIYEYVSLDAPLDAPVQTEGFYCG